MMGGVVKSEGFRPLLDAAYAEFLSNYGHQGMDYGKLDFCLQEVFGYITDYSGDAMDEIAREAIEVAYAIAKNDYEWMEANVKQFVMHTNAGLLGQPYTLDDRGRGFDPSGIQIDGLAVREGCNYATLQLPSVTAANRFFVTLKEWALPEGE